ncbi:MAG: M20/M25/M40 family metallo-hydrolase [Planctomycetes bacterium]|nr:M20/M25/M40 family metallo-hydrolase [Planctomycetota bacterium]
MSLDAAAILELHRQLVAIPSVSKNEAEIVAFAANRLERPGIEVRVLGRNLIARRGRGPTFLLNSHLDTVPPAADWTRPPHEVEVIDGRVYGLGANDAKASVAAMIAAFLAADVDSLGLELVLMLVCDEETGGAGTEYVLPQLVAEGLRPVGAVVGEPTGLDVAASQKGMMVVELIARGESAHSANARALGLDNAIWALARDLVALEGLDLGPEDEGLGRTTMEPTVLSGGQARNRTPAEVRCLLDLRTVPSTPHAELIARLAGAVRGELLPTSLRLEPRACPEDALVLAAARAARPEARVYGSPTMSDLVFMKDWPAIKCGPGRSERSHRADEFVLESEILEGVLFYARLIDEVALRAGGDYRGEEA